MGDAKTPGDIFGSHDWGCYWHLRGRRKDPGNILQSTGQPVIRKKYPVQNVNSAQVEKTS